MNRMDRFFAELAKTGKTEFTHKEWMRIMCQVADNPEQRKQISSQMAPWRGFTERIVRLTPKGIKRL